MDSEIKNEFGAVRTDTATRRHFDIIAESLRHDIRIIAEGPIALDAKVEAMR